MNFKKIKFGMIIEFKVNTVREMVSFALFEKILELSSSILIKNKFHKEGLCPIQKICQHGKSED